MRYCAPPPLHFHSCPLPPPPSFLCPLFFHLAHVSFSVCSSSKGKGKDDAPGPPPQLFFNVRTPLNNGHGTKLHEDTVWAGVECLAVFILDCGLFLPATQVSLAT